MQQAGARAADAREQAEEAAEAHEAVPEMVLTTDRAAILDMKGLLALPVEEDEPIDSLRMLLVPKGKWRACRAGRGTTSSTAPTPSSRSRAGLSSRTT